MQIIDEAARYAPQELRSGDSDAAKCLGIIESLCEEGRNIGIGLTFLTLRSARLNKAVAELAQCMVAFRTIGPNSVKAIMDWLGEHIAKERHKELVEQIRTNPVGTALIVSPGWLEFEGVAAIRLRETFDSSKTPTGGGTLRAPTKAKKPDLVKYQERMKETIERAKADDPKELRAKIKQLEREKAELAKRPAATPAESKPAKTRDVLIVPEKHIERVQKAAAVLEAAMSKAMAVLTGGPIVQTAKLLEAIHKDLLDGKAKIAAASAAGFRGHNNPTVSRDSKAVNDRATFPRKREIHEFPESVNKPPREAGESLNGPLPRGEAAVLSAAIQFPDGLQREQISVLCGYKARTRNDYIFRLRNRGYVNDDGNLITATQAGRAALPDAQPLPTGEELQRYWLARLPQGEAALLRLLIEQYPNSVERDWFDEATSYAPRSRNDYLFRLHKKQLTEEPTRSQVKASDNLF
jgi:hypothetical protein